MEKREEVAEKNKGWRKKQSKKQKGIIRGPPGIKKWGEYQEKVQGVTMLGWILLEWRKGQGQTNYAVKLRQMFSSFQHKLCYSNPHMAAKH